jgi:SAM-dependent methyltransferase
MPAAELSSFVGFVQPGAHRVLSIGSGKGDLDVLLAAQIDHDEDVHVIQWDAVEPNGEHLVDLHNNLKTISETTGASTRLFEGTIESLTSSDSPIAKSKYSIIHMIHCVHWFQDPVASLVKSRSLLAVGGKLLVYLQSDRGVPRLYGFMEKLKGHGLASLTAEALCKSIQAHDDDFKLSMHHIPATLDVSDIISRSDTGYQILSFLLSCDLTTPLLKEDQRVKDLIHYIQDLANDQKQFNEPIGVIEIFASSSLSSSSSSSIRSILPLACKSSIASLSDGTDNQ